MGSSGFRQELSRHACRIAAACVVVGWVPVKASTPMFPMLHRPEWIDRFVVRMIPGGFAIRNHPSFEALLKKYAATAEAVVASAVGP